MHGPPLGFPSRIDFPNVAPGQFATSAGGGLPRHAGAVSVRIDGDAAGVFSVSSLEVLELTPRDPDLPPGPPLVWETVSTQDGSGPITLDAAQALAVFVEFVCPANPQVTSFSGTAVVHTTDPAPVTVMQLPITGSVRVIAGSVTLVSLSVPSINVGGSAQLGFRLSSTLGTEVGGTLTCDRTSSNPSPFTSDVDPQFPIVEPGTSVDVSLLVNCAAGTPVGDYPTVFQYRMIDNSQIFASVQVTIKVGNNRSVTINPSLNPDVTLEQGSSTLCELRVEVSGSPTTFNLQTGSVPNGVSIENGQQSVAVNGTVFLGVTIDVSSTAPNGKAPVPLVFNWSVPPDEFFPAVSGSQSFNLTISLVSIEFVPQNSPIVSGEVQATDVRVAFASNGDWTFAGRLHDFSSVFGDNFALGFAFNFTDGKAHGPAATGVLGSSLTRNPETQVFGMHGNDPWLVQNWQKAFPSGGIFKLHTSGDLAQVLSDLGDDFKNALGEIFVSPPGTDCPTDPQTDEPSCPEPGTGDGGGEGGP